MGESYAETLDSETEFEDDASMFGSDISLGVIHRPLTDEALDILEDDVGTCADTEEYRESLILGFEPTESEDEIDMDRPSISRNGHSSVPSTEIAEEGLEALESNSEWLNDSEDEELLPLSDTNENSVEFQTELQTSTMM
eukprot:1459660-Karenia_brevis.AAC.1